MFELGPDKLVFILLAVLVFLGPKELPAIVRTIGKWRRQVRSFQDTLRAEIGSVLELPSGTTKPAEPPHPPTRRDDDDDR